MNKINQEATDNFNKKQQILLKELQNCHRNNVKLEQKDKDFFRKNNKAAVEVDVSNLNKSQVKSLQCLQKQVGERKLVLSKFSRCHAENMYQPSETPRQANCYITFGVENSINTKQNKHFWRNLTEKTQFLHGKSTKPKIAKSNLPIAFT